MRIPDTRTDLLPITLTCDPLLQPTRVVLQVILRVDSVQDWSAFSSISHRISKYDKANKSSYDEEHSPQIKVHEEGISVTRAGKAS